MRQSSGSRRVIVSLMVIHALLVSWCALRSGFAWTEVGLLPAGVIDWRYGSYDVFRVNPPLVRMWATLPVLALNPDVPFAGTLSDPRSRAQWEVGAAMLKVDARAAERNLTIARLFCLPFSIAGMWVAVRLAKAVCRPCRPRSHRDHVVVNRIGVMERALVGTTRLIHSKLSPGITSPSFRIPRLA
jgi:hypothetical protein